ncbi:MAG: ThaI family type II restriction endonuclease [Candidatus Saccharicenans sp.]
MKLPKPGTNPRGVEISKEALISLIKLDHSNSIPIYWQKSEININPYKRWVELWKED